jgi:glucosyl-3-phosphoglycerate synthase
LTLKGQVTVSVVIPARDEAATIGTVVERLRAGTQQQHRLLKDLRLIDELVVIDCGSRDHTADVARTAGARVVDIREALPHIPVVLGKGEALWRGVAATSGDIVVFVDADLADIDSSWIAALVGPMLADDSVMFVKASYDRPTDPNGLGGGRVTELVARPLLSLHWPDAAAVQQPIGGEYAARRGLLESLPFACGYGVDFGLLVDTVTLHGIDAVAQVDLGSRRHRNRPTRELGRTAAEVWLAAAHRLGLNVPGQRDLLTQFARMDGLVQPVTVELVADERPALCEVDDRLNGSRGQH